MSNFEITAAGVKAFKVYGIGAGNFRSWTSFTGTFNQEVVKGKLLAFVLKWISVLYIILVS